MSNLIGKEVITTGGHRGQVIKHFYATARGMVIHIQECDGRIWGCPESDIIEILNKNKVSMRLMNKQKALEITKDRIESMKKFTPSNASELHIAKETMEWLEFIEKILEEV